MDSFIDKLADILRTLLGSDGASGRGRPGTGAATGGAGRGAPYDPDLREAWDELDDFMKGGPGSEKERADGTGSGSSRRPAQHVDESLRPDYANLEVPFGADIETVRKSYKSLMLKYHPDKHSGSAEQQRIALEITKKINESFERIRSRQGSR